MRKRLKVRLKFGQHLRQLRKERKLSQEKMAELTAVDHRYYKRYESKKPPSASIDTLANMAGALKIHLSELMDF